MRIALNGSFLQQPATGSGQYTIQLIRELDQLLEEPLRVIVPVDSRLPPATSREPPAEDLGSASLARSSLYLREVVRTRRAKERLAQPEKAGASEPHQPILLPDRQFLIGGTRAQLVAVAPPVLGHRQAAKVWFEQIGFPRAARAGRVDLVHVPYFGPPYRSPRPVVVTIHDLIMMVLPRHRGPLPVRLYTWLAGRSARQACLVLTDSNCSRRDVTERLGIPADRIRVIPLACDDRFRPDVDRAAIEKARRDYNLDRPYAFYLGGFDWRKNVPGLIAAFGQVPTDRLLAIGGAVPPPGDALFPDPREAIRRSPAAERIRLIGRVAEADKPALYAGAELFVFPSRYEGFGLTVLEAMASATPVVCSRVGGLPEIVPHGRTGYLVEPGDEVGLRERIQVLLEDDSHARRLGGAARELVRTEFSWDTCAERCLDAYALK